MIPSPIPTNLDEAVAALISYMSAEDKEMLADDERLTNVCSFYHDLGTDLGTDLRNNWKLWDGNAPLTRWFRENRIFHADDMSAVIFEATRAHLRNEPFNIVDEAAYYEIYWNGCGLTWDQKPLSDNDD